MSVSGVLFSVGVCVCDLLISFYTDEEIGLVHRRFIIQRGHEHTRTGN